MRPAGPRRPDRPEDRPEAPPLPEPGPGHQAKRQRPEGLAGVHWRLLPCRCSVARLFRVLSAGLSLNLDCACSAPRFVLNLSICVSNPQLSAFAKRFRAALGQLAESRASTWNWAVGLALTRLPDALEWTSLKDLSRVPSPLLGAPGAALHAPPATAGRPAAAWRVPAGPSRQSAYILAAGCTCALREAHAVSEATGRRQRLRNHQSVEVPVLAFS